MTAPRAGLPVAARAFIILIAIGGAAAAAAMLARTPHWTIRDAAALLGLATAVAVSEQFWIELRHRTERENFSLTDALFVASLLLFRPSVTVLAVGLARHGDARRLDVDAKAQPAQRERAQAHASRALWRRHGTRREAARPPAAAARRRVQRSSVARSLHHPCLPAFSVHIFAGIGLRGVLKVKIPDGSRAI